MDRWTNADGCPLAVTAVLAIANIVKSSLGPVGLDKMLVDDIGVRSDAPPFIFSNGGLRRT